MNETVTGATFKVSDVEKTTKPFYELPCHQALALFLHSRIACCSHYHQNLIATTLSHPLIDAIHRSFSFHRPLVLSPDIIWITITQGLARHINHHAERLRTPLISRRGKPVIEVRRDDVVKKSTRNPWREFFPELSENVHEYIGEAYDVIVSDFSTTGPVERVASEVVLLDTMQKYFRYRLFTICGIPSITLEGTVSDWRSLVKRTERFREYGLKWWIDPLLPVLEQFVSAADGDTDREFWDSIYKIHGASGGPYISGWVLSFFPYLCKKGKLIRNPWLCRGLVERLYERLSGSRRCHPSATMDDFPYDVSTVPFEWECSPHHETHQMEFIGGIVGVSQDKETLSLRPEIGWAVRDKSQKKRS